MAASDQWLIHRTAFPPADGSLSARPHTPLIRTVYCTTIPRLRFHRLPGTASHDGVVLWVITVPRAPSPEGRCYLLSARDSYPCRQALPRLSRSYGLMRRTEILSLPQFYPCTVSLCRLLRAPAGSRSFPTLICESFSACLDPYPACSLGVLAHFFPRDNGLPDKPSRSALQNISLQQLQ